MKQGVAIEVSQVRSFGLIVGGVFAILGIWPYVMHGQELREWALGVALVLVAPTLVFPKILIPVYRGWMLLGGALGWLNTRVILAIGFFLVITPIGIVMQLFGKKPLHLKFDSSSLTYRENRPSREGLHMERQF